MADYNKYKDFFDSYGGDHEYNPEAEYRRRRLAAKKKALKRKRRFIRCVTALFLAVIVAVAAVVTVTVKKHSKSNNASSDAYTLHEITSSGQETGQQSEPQITAPVSTSATVKLGSQIDSQYAILVDCSNNNVLAEKSPDERIYPASMTKVMTLLVAAENVDSIDGRFTMTNEIIDPLYKEGASRAGFCAGENVRIADMFYGTVLESGAEAAVGLAVYVSGSEEKFVELMNQKAAQLGLKSTLFTNVTGLHDKNLYTTCREMAIIMRAALENDFCKTVLSTEYYTVAANDFHDELKFHSTMLSRMYGTEPGVATIKGGKTGFTANSGNCLVSYAETDDGREIICVTAVGGGRYKPIFDCINMYKDYTHPSQTASASSGTASASEK